VTARTGATLVELLVVLAILAVTSSLASVAFRRAETGHDRDAGDQVLALRREAIAAGRPFTRLVRRDATSFVVTALPDGRVLADSVLRVDPSTGLRRAKTH
jgi:prepilin-type N-terminal cleavage/methylation domain-containing protein